MSNKLPKVTIITITLNRESLKKACESIDRQTFTDYYHIILGDGVLPTDYSNEKRMCLGFSKVIGITEPGANMPNGTPNPMQRWALQHLDFGEYVCFLDDDNMYRENYLEEMTKALDENPDKGIALCGACDLRYGQDIDGYPEDFRCDNSAFMARKEVVKAITFPMASLDKNVTQDCEYIKLCACKYGFVNVPLKLLDFGVFDNVPPNRGKVLLLESWKKPQEAYHYALNEEYETAEDILKTCYNDNVNDGWSLFKLIEIYTILQKEKELRGCVEKFLKLLEVIDQNSGYFYYTLSFCQHMLKREYKRSIYDAINSTKEQMDDNSNYFFLSLYYLFDGCIDKAVENYKKAIDLFPDENFWANKEFNWTIRVYENLEDTKEFVKIFYSKI